MAVMIKDFLWIASAFNDCCGGTAEVRMYQCLVSGKNLGA